MHCSPTIQYANRFLFWAENSCKLSDSFDADIEAIFFCIFHQFRESETKNTHLNVHIYLFFKENDFLLQRLKNLQYLFADTQFSKPESSSYPCFYSKIQNGGPVKSFLRVLRVRTACHDRFRSCSKISSDGLIICIEFV